MKVWRVWTCDHRLEDQSDESSSCEIFGAGRWSTLREMINLVREALAQPEDNGDTQYPAEPVDDQTLVECFVDEIKLVELSTKKLVIACLNGSGWMTSRQTETVLIDKDGRVFSRGIAPSANHKLDAEIAKLEAEQNAHDWRRK